MFTNKTKILSLVQKLKSFYRVLKGVKNSSDLLILEVLAGVDCPIALLDKHQQDSHAGPISELISLDNIPIQSNETAIVFVQGNFTSFFFSYLSSKLDQDDFKLLKSQMYLLKSSTSLALHQETPQQNFISIKPLIFVLNSLLGIMKQASDTMRSQKQVSLFRTFRTWKIICNDPKALFSNPTPH